MSTIPPKAEARRRPVSVLALKLWEVAEALEERLDQPSDVLEILVSSAAKGEQALETWQRLHEAAERFQKTSELAQAYEQLTQDKRIKLLPPEQQAFIFLQATGFFTSLGDTEGAAGYAERAITAVPGHADAFAQLEALLTAAGKMERLARLYLDASQRETDPIRRLRLLQRSAAIAIGIDAADLIIDAGQKLLKLTPEDEEVRDEVMRRLLAFGRHKEVVELLEHVLSGDPSPPPEEAKLHREQLVDLCLSVLKSPERALTHVEGLLKLDPTHAMALASAESLLDNKQLMLRAAAALSDACERSGNVERAVAMLTFELRHVRGLRRTEVQRRLGILRHDALGDPAGALELLAPVVAGDPGDDDLRRRFVELSLSLNQPAETARLLSRALQSHRDPAVRARVGVDVGDVYLKSGDVKRAQAAFQKVLETQADDRASLAAAHRLADLNADSGDLKQLANVLETIVRLESEKELRQAAARRLARLSDGEVPDAERAILAFRALVGSPWTDEALSRLETLYAEAGDDVGLSDVLAFRAERCKDPAQARELASRALELRTARTRDPESAISAYESFTKTFGATREVHARLMPLLEQTGRYAELADVLTRELALAPEADRAKLWLRLATIRLGRLSDAEGALQALSRALEMDPTDRAVRGALEKLLTIPEVRIQAANLLEPLYMNEEPSLGWLRVLEARVEGEDTVEARLAAAENGVSLAQGPLRDAERALEIAARALADAVAQAPSQIEHWLAEVLRLGANSPERRGRALFSALSGRGVDTREMFDLAQAAGDAAQAAGDLPRAIEVYRKALAFDPSSRKLLQAIDELLAQQGAPIERLALYEAALAEEREPQRRRDLLHAMARLQRVELGDALGAVVTLRRAVAEEPRDLAGHDALLDALGEAGDFAGAAVELERVLPLLEGDRRSFALLRLAEAAERAGDAAGSLARYRELLGVADLADDVLANVERLALEQADGVTLRSVLEQRLLGTTDPRQRVQLLERLGNAASWQLGDVASAARFWLEGARLSEGAAADAERARRLYDRVLDAEPKNREAAERLVELCAVGHDWARLSEVFGILLEAADEREIIATLLALEEPALESGAAREYVELVDRALARGSDPQRVRHLVLAKARAQGTLAERADEAAALFRAQIESAGDDSSAEVEALGEFLRRAAPSAARHDDKRWLYRFRAQHATDSISVLLDWARAEEHELASPEAARALYERITTQDPDQTEAWTELARLQAASGDPASALSSLEALRLRVDGDVRLGIELRIAGLLIESLERAPEALALVRPILAANPSDMDALRIVHRALAIPATRADAAELLEQAADAFEDPARRADVIEALLAVSAEAPELSLARSRWLTQLLETKSDAPEEALRIALRGAEAAPGEIELWKVAEQMARRLDDPNGVVEAYTRAFERTLPAEVAEELGQRMVEFYGEWFDEPERVVQMLRRVLELCPTAGWAFDRLKLAFNGAGRWSELFSLYDARLTAPLEPPARIDLLREAAMAARDFAGDPERAISYLEALNRENPGDVRVEASLERLYERHAKRRPLIDLLTARLAGVKAADQGDLVVRIASLWLDLAEPEEALARAEQLLEDPERVVEAVQLLERLITLPAAAARRALPAEVPIPLLRATAHLKAYYRGTSSPVDVVRMLELEEGAAATSEERRVLLEEIVGLRLKVLGDALGAFETTAELVLLDPEPDKYRPSLATLAAKVDVQARRSDVLVAAARKHELPLLRAGLLNEAASVQRQALSAPDRAAELYREVLTLPGVPEAAELEAGRAMSELLAEAGDPLERVAVLERLADLAPTLDERRQALGDAAAISFDTLGDAPRAISAYRKRLADDVRDLLAMNGLCLALESVQRWDELISALEARANIEAEVDARRDRVRIAELHAAVRADRPTAIQAWRRVVELHGGDAASFEALRGLLAAEQRWNELAELFNTEIESTAHVDARHGLFLELGALHEQRTNDRILALEAYVAALDWESAVRVAGAKPPDRATGRRVCARLLELATAVWVAANDGPTSDAARTADWALSELAERLLEDGEYEAVVDQLLAGSELPFLPLRRRDLRREAACLVSDRLGDIERAIELFQALLAQDPADDVAVSSVTRLALLLEEKGRFDEIVTLWEEQAAARAGQGDVAGAQVLWARAGELCEDRLDDVDRALAAYDRGAALRGEACLEALARIHQRAGRIELVADALERLCQESSADTLGERALALSEAYVALGKPHRARETLEQVVSRVVEGAPLRARLATLYREAKDFTRLATLIEEEANRAEGRTQLSLLREAAELHLDQRAEPGPAVPLLERAIELSPDDSSLRLLLARALYEGQRFADAADVLREQLARYGSRRPKDRALVHFELARALLAAEDRVAALVELDAAAKIDPAHPSILEMLARTALEQGELERAERMYRALLLVAGKDPHNPTSRAEALFALGEVAEARGDSARAEEFSASAFDAALEDPREAAALERALSKRSRPELLSRVLELRLGQALPPREAARLLSDLSELYAGNPRELKRVRKDLLERARRVEAEVGDTTAIDDATWAALGRTYVALGDAASEARVLERRIEASARSSRPPPDGDLLYRLASARLADGTDLEGGLDLLERAMTLSPDFERAEALLRSAEGDLPPRAVLLLERIARERGDQRALLAALERRMLTGDADIAGLREGVEIAEQLAEPDLAERLLARALSSRAFDSVAEHAAWVRLELGRHWRARGELGSALDMEEEAVQFLQPSEGLALLRSVTDAARAAGDSARAARLLERLRLDDPENPEVFLPLLELYREIPDVERLAELLEATAPLVTSAEQRTRLRLEHVDLLLERLGRRDDAIQLLKEIVLDVPGDRAARTRLSELLSADGREDELVDLLAMDLEEARQAGDADGIAMLALRLASLLQRQGKSAEALDVCRSALARDPGRRELLELNVRLAKSADEPQRLAEAFEQLLAVERGPAAAALCRRLLALYEDLDDPVGAERALELGVAACPSDAALCDELVRRYGERGDAARMAALLEGALAERPDDRVLLERLIAAQRAAGQHERALEVVEGVLRRHVDDAVLRRIRAGLYSELGRDREAIEDLEQAALADSAALPDLVEALDRAILRSTGAERIQLSLRLVSVLEASGELDAARARLAELALEFPEDISVLSRRGALEAHAENLDGAIDAYTRLGELSTGFELTSAALTLAELCTRAGRSEAARPLLEKAQSADPHQSELRAALCAVLEASGAHRELGQILLGQALETDVSPERAALLLRAAELLLAGDDVEHALSALETLRSESPENLDAVVLIARAYTRIARLDQALLHLGSAIDASRGKRLRALAPIYEEKANVHLEEGFLTDALGALGKAFEMDAKNARLGMRLGQLALEAEEEEIAQRALRAVAIMKTAEVDGPDGARPETKADANYALAVLAQRASDPRKAKILAAKAISENPAHEAARALLAQFDRR